MNIHFQKAWHTSLIEHTGYLCPQGLHIPLTNQLDHRFKLSPFTSLSGVLKSWIFFEFQTQDNWTILKLFGCFVCSAPLPFFKHFQSSFEIVCSFTSNYSFHNEFTIIMRESVLQLFDLMDAFPAHQQYYSIEFKSTSCLQHLHQFCITIQKLSAVPQVCNSSKTLSCTSGL